MKKNTSKVFGAGQGKLKSLLGFVFFLFTKPGYELLKRIARKTLFKESPVDYRSWIKNELNPAILREEFDIAYPLLKKKPVFTIIHVIESNKSLGTLVNSILAQLYPEWELLLVNTGKGNIEINATTQLKIITAETNTSFAECYNIALQKAIGDFILLLRSDTQLTPNSLFEFAMHINENPNNTIIYADEDQVDVTRSFSTPYFKPNWSPDSFLSRNYIGDAFIIKTKAAQSLRVRDVSGGGELYDLLLRASETTKHIGHIPQVLFHFNEHTTYHLAPAKVITDTLTRRKTPAEIATIANVADAHYIKYQVSAMGKVSIIIPTKDQVSLLKTALDSILIKTTYPDYEILILNNSSTSNDFFNLANDYNNKYPGKFRCIDASFPFNFSKLINLGVAEIKGSYVLMLNNDIEVLDGNWMTDMVAYAQLKHIGAVGTKLLYPDDTIQHAGIVMGINGDSGHVFINTPKDTNGYYGNTKTATNYSAVTGACLMCRKELYLQVSGMDEALAVEYNDLDLCFRFMQTGHYNVCIPVELYHHESASRGHPFRSKAAWLQHEKEFATFKKKWHHIIDNDPFYNPNLSLKATDFRLK
ncbi:MAG: glycosyl transferase family 2 [Flavipsychrobacter sp.]|jgi:GT2 family glycosyltransferase|nr:glycosyl transferase family 2 [Flavipsychrobacter sp.]